MLKRLHRALIRKDTGRAWAVRMRARARASSPDGDDGASDEVVPLPRLPAVARVVAPVGQARPRRGEGRGGGMLQEELPDAHEGMMLMSS